MHDLVSGLDRLAIELKRSLGGDQVDQLLNGLDVGRLEISLAHHPGSVGSGVTQLFRTGSVGLQVHVFAGFEQSVGIDELGELDLTLRIERLRTGLANHDFAIGVDHDGGGVLWNLDRRVDQAARLSTADDELAVGVDVKIAGSRVHWRLARGVEHADIAATFDGRVEFTPGLLECSLALVRLRTGHAHAEADLGAHGRGSLLGITNTGVHLSSIEQVFEISTILFEPRRVDVRQIISDHVQLRLHRLHAGSGGV